MFQTKQLDGQRHSLTHQEAVSLRNRWVLYHWGIYCLSKEGSTPDHTHQWGGTGARTPKALQLATKRGLVQKQNDTSSKTFGPTSQHPQDLATPTSGWGLALGNLVALQPVAYIPAYLQASQHKTSGHLDCEAKYPMIWSNTASANILCKRQGLVINWTKRQSHLPSIVSPTLWRKNVACLKDPSAPARTYSFGGRGLCNPESHRKFPT